MSHSCSMIGLSYIRNYIKDSSLDYSGIYRMLSASNDVLYIGKAKNLKNRLKSYMNFENLSVRIRSMILQVAKIEILITKSEHEALILEASLIKSLKPKYNILLKDDKSYPYILITKDHDFPQILKFRGKKVAGNGVYFGPFASSGDVDDSINILQRAFQIRNCSDSYFANRSRPCLQYQIKRCSAPCVQKVTKEQYSQQVKQAQNFMSGKNKDVQKKIIEAMEKYSEALEFEKAAGLRDQIHLLNKVQQKNIAFQNLHSTDLIAISRDFDIASIFIFFYRNGFSFGHKEFYPDAPADIETSQILSQFLMFYYKDREDLPKEIILNTPSDDQNIIEEIIKCKIKTPTDKYYAEIMEFASQNAHRALVEKLKHKKDNTAILKQIGDLVGSANIKLIEVYDNSHISGSNAIGAMIATGESGFIKNNYRTFNIKSNDKGDDLAMMEEVLGRRLEKLIHDAPQYIENIWPDIIIVDGGKNQLNAAIKVSNKLELNGKIKLISIAKGEHRDKGNEIIYTDSGEVITLPNDDDRLKYLQILRDEVHRFAITTYRKKHIKKMTKSELMSIPGIGDKRRKILFNYFGSVENIKNASIEELLKADQIDTKTAEKIYTYFRQE